MTQVLIVVGFFIAAFALMAVSLHFSKYKKRDSGCCGGGNCIIDENGNRVSSCYSDKEEFVDNYSKRTVS